MPAFSIQILVLSIFALTEVLYSEEEITVEVLVVLEKEIADEYKFESERKANICSIFKEVQGYYDNFEGVKINIVLSGIKTLTGPYFRPSTDLPPYKHPTIMKEERVVQFSRFMQTQIWSNRYDVILLLIKEVFLGNASLFNGLSYLNGACVRTRKVGIMIPDPRIIAHELGHLLGAQDDGTKNTCSSKDGYIMQSGTAIVSVENYHRFSNCSIEEITRRIRSPEAHCLYTNDIMDSVKCGQITSCSEHCLPITSVVSRTIDDLKN